MSIEIPDKNDAGSVDQWLREKMDDSVLGELAPLSEVVANAMYDHRKQIIGTVVQYKELMMMYACAMKEVRTKFEVLNTEFNVRYERNPISSISTRLKKTASIGEKLGKRGSPLSLAELENNVNDVAGVRVVCSYIDDIYLIADAFLKQDDVTLISQKDYIANPKPNGYRSLHLLVAVPVYFADHKKDIKVEVQIRTIAMDFWASLEHQLKYKKNVDDQRGIADQLKMCAEVIAATDERMLDIRKQMEDMADAPTEDEVLFDKLRKFDVALD